MKIRKFLSTMLLLLFVFSLASCGDDEIVDPALPGPTPPTVDPRFEITAAEPETTRHLLLNKDGSFGGSRDESIYGKGSPKNGASDIINSPFYSVVNYWQRGCTATRTLFYHFRPYQKTMAHSDGISCILSVLNYFGYDTDEKYTELNMYDKYEEVNFADLSKEKEDLDGLCSLLDSYGISYDASFIGSPDITEAGVTEWVQNFLDFGCPIIVPYHDGQTGWVVIVGIDNMGTSTTHDDVLIMMDPNDCLDHYQDGWTVCSSEIFHTWWNETYQNGYRIRKEEFIAIYPPNEFDYQKNSLQLVNEIDIKLENPENHLLIQPDGAFYSNYYIDVFNSLYHKKAATKGERTPWTDWSQVPNHHSDSYYYVRPDFYNMVNDPSIGLLICSEYRAHVQNCSSTCGICSMTNIMQFYGFDTMCEGSEWSEAQVASDFEKETGYTIQGNGIGAGNAGKLLKSTKYAAKFSVKTYNSYSAKGSSTKEVKTDLTGLWCQTYDAFVQKVIDNIGVCIPIAVSWRPCHGHWTQIIGICTYNDDDPYNDVIIMGDSSDWRDHYFDGYDLYPAMTFYNRWYNGSHSLAQAHYTFVKK